MDIYKCPKPEILEIVCRKKIKISYGLVGLFLTLLLYKNDTIKFLVENLARFLYTIFFAQWYKNGIWNEQKRATFIVYETSRA